MTSSNRNITRREFIGTSAAAGVSTFAAPVYLSALNKNEKLNIAVIGAGGRGGGNLNSVSSENIVALCDVNENNLNRAAIKHPNAKKFRDFRKLFEHSNDFDAVVVSTCEHTHAFATLPSLQLGKHVYCEKPLAYNVEETRIIRQAADKAGVATQMGTQIHAGENYRRVVELVQSGAIGNVTEAHIWVGRAWGRHENSEDAKKHHDIIDIRERPSKADPIPAGLDWDLWLGPAPARPFSNVYFPGPKWYRWWDFGNGTMSDLGSHWIDLPFWALKLDAPKTIEASGPKPHPEIAPASMQVKYEYGAREDFGPVTVNWYQGDNKPQIWKDKGIPQWGSAALFIGDKGMLLSDYGKHVLLPEDKFVDYKRPAPYIPKSLGHHAEWIHACKTGEPTTCNFHYSGLLTEANHLGNVAFRTGHKLEWDTANMKVTNSSDAERYIKRNYRKGWSLT